MKPFKTRIDQAARMIREAQNLTAFTGAGISTESGISDFRSPGGVWDRYRVVTFQEFISSREARMEYWKMKRELFNEMKNARPNLAHQSLAVLETMGKLTCLITQNIDGLHQEAGNSPDMVIELHGTNRQALCLQCGETWPIEEIQARLESGESDPTCFSCRGLIKPATISFGQSMPESKMQKAHSCASMSRLFLMIGSSLQVEPAASLPAVAYEAGSKLIFINRTETPKDHMAKVIFRENAGETLEAIMKDLEGR